MSGERKLWATGLQALVGANVATLLVRWLALTVIDVSPEFPPLAGPVPTIFFTVVGALGAIAVYGWLRGRSDRPETLFRQIAVVVLVLSFLPDLWLLSDGAVATFPGATPAAVGVLMTMHVVAAAVIVLVLTARGRT